MFKTLQRAWRLHQLQDPAYQFLFDPAPPDEWVSIDCETTGLDRANDHIISIGAVPIRGQQVLTSQRLEILIRSDGERAALTAENVRIHQLREAAALHFQRDLGLTVPPSQVIVSAGAIASPKLLMLSGIGPREHLQAMGIDVRVDAPQVGENFQDHLSASVYAQTRQPSSLLGHDRGLRAVGHGLKYLATRTGLLSSNVVESGAFVDATGCGRPDVQFHVVPALVGDIDRMPPAGHGISVNPCARRPRSRGRLRLKSADPLAEVALNANYLSDPEDMRTMVAGVKLARKILRAPALANVVERMLMLPENDDVPDTVFEDYVRAVAKTVFHPAGTCRMGSDAAAVVDPTLRVRGVQGLRVADASIMPTIVSGNTNAPCIMIGERCADFILSAQA